MYTLKPNPSGYGVEVRMIAIRMYVEGNSDRAIARILKVRNVSMIDTVGELMQPARYRTPSLVLGPSGQSGICELVRAELGPTNYRDDTS